MDVLEAIRNRRSDRRYSATAIPGAAMDRLCRSLRYAPSACNYQPWKFIFVADEGVRRAVASAAKDQMWMAEAPLIVVGCGFLYQAYKQMGGSGNSVDVDLAIAIDHLTLAATAEGLGTCWIGAFDEDQVKKLLRVPADVKVVAMTPVGFPAKEGMICPVSESRRKDQAEIFSIDYFDGQAG